MRKTRRETSESFLLMHRKSLHLHHVCVYIYISSYMVRAYVHVHKYMHTCELLLIAVVNPRDFYGCTNTITKHHPMSILKMTLWQLM